MGKPATIIGAGGRSGTARAQMQLLETLSETGNLVMIKPGVLVPAFSPRQFDSDGDLIDEDTRQSLRRHLEEFGKWIVMNTRGREFVRWSCEMDIQLAHS